MRTDDPSTGLRMGDLFAGIGGVSLGFDQAGIRPVWWVENNDDARTIMRREWPDAAGYGDIREFLELIDNRGAVEYVECIAGGDPCPIHSRARSSHGTSSPDLSGYFLAVVGAMRPKWVVRENVRSSNVEEFAFGLELLGYGSITVIVDAAPVTGQSRIRAFTIGRYQTPRSLLQYLLPEFEAGRLPSRAALGTRQVASCLTTHRTRYDSRDNYILEYSGGGLGAWGWHLRIPDAEEREALAGFPSSWTAGLHEATRARLLGNSVVPAIARWLAAGIASYERRLLASPPARGGLGGMTWD